MSRVMALDVGDRRIGVALSDPLGLFATPTETVDRTTRRQGATRIAQLAKEKEVSTIVVGWPTELSGTDGPQANKVREFTRHLEAELAKTVGIGSVKIERWDERLSSIEAERYLAGSSLKDRERRAKLDQLAAAVILNAYLNRIRPPEGPG